MGNPVGGCAAISGDRALLKLSDPSLFDVLGPRPPKDDIRRQPQDNIVFKVPGMSISKVLLTKSKMNLRLRMVDSSQVIARHGCIVTTRPCAARAKFEDCIPIPDLHEVVLSLTTQMPTLHAVSGKVVLNKNSGLFRG